MALFWLLFLAVALLYLWVKLVKLAVESDRRDRWVTMMKAKFDFWNN
jgi:hypothetical protein